MFRLRDCNKNPLQVLVAIAELDCKQLRWPGRKEDLTAGLFSRELFDSSRCKKFG